MFKLFINEVWVEAGEREEIGAICAKLLQLGLNARMEYFAI